jgi:hypothetical protein
MYVIEIFLPTFATTGERFPQRAFDRIRRNLMDHFGGVTAFLRSPALGLWEDAAGRVHRDEIVVFEVMSETLDHEWWHRYRIQLEEWFRQDEVVIRAHTFERL